MSIDDKSLDVHQISGVGKNYIWVCENVRLCDCCILLLLSSSEDSSDWLNLIMDQ